MAARLGRALCLSLVCATSICAAADDDLFEEHHAHEHGAATLDVALDGDQLRMQFRTPAINLLGFEHAPRTSRDHAAMEQAMQLLRDAAGQFQPSTPARCRVVTANVTPPSWKTSEDHADFEAEYLFRCEQPDALQQIEVRLLSKLDDVKVKAQVASAKGQHGAELTRAKPRLPLQVNR